MKGGQTSVLRHQTKCPKSRACCVAVGAGEGDPYGTAIGAASGGDPIDSSWHACEGGTIVLILQTGH